MAELGLTRGVAIGTVGEGLVDNIRTSLGEEREAIERGQEMERLIGPESVGEAVGAVLVLSDLIGGFQCMRPVSKQKKGEQGKEGRSTDSLSHFSFSSSLILSQFPSHCQALLSAFHPLPGGFRDEVWH